MYKLIEGGDHVNMRRKTKKLTAAKEKVIADLMKKYQLCYDDARLLFTKALYITRKYEASLYEVSGIIMGAWEGSIYTAEKSCDSEPLYTFDEFMRLFMEEINKPVMKDVESRWQD